MVAKLFRLLQKEFNGLHEAAFLLGFFALLSQIVAIVRDRIFASYFGAGVELDIYYAAFRIPDIIFVSVSSFVAITVVMPFFIAKYEKDKEQAKCFINNVFSVFFILIVIVCSVMYFFIPSIVERFMSFDKESAEMVVTLSRILLLSPILLGISNIFASITQSFQNFLVYAISPVLYNIGIVIGLVVFYPMFDDLKGLALGVVLGAFLHMAIQLPVVIKHGFMPRFIIRFSLKEIKGVATLALPRTLGLSAQQLALFVLVALASSMAIGSISVFQLAFNLQSVPLSIIGVSYSVAAFPTLARLYSKRKMNRFVKQVLTAVRHIVFWSFPIMFLFIVLRAQIVRTILGAGEFDWSDTRLTAAILAIFAVSVIAQSLILLMVRAYYAAGNTKVPVLINTISAIFIILLAYFFNHLFSQFDVIRYFFEALLRVENISGTNVLALPFAYSTGMIMNVFLLWHFFKKDFVVKQTDRLQQTFRHSLYGAFVMGFISYNLLDVFDDVLDLNTFFGIFLQGALAGIGGIVFGIALLKVMKNHEIKEIQKALHRKFWKTKTVLPDQTKL